jgi:hypothetical protein
VAAGGLTRHAPIARAAAAADGDFVQMGSTHQNFSATGTFLEPATLSSPVQLLSVGNQSSLTSDLTHACGVEGSGPNNSNGVIGLCNGSSAYAIWGQTDSGFGVVGQSSTGVAVAAIGSGRFLQAEQLFAGAPTSGSWGAGEQIRDIHGDLWICVVTGSPGQWRQVSAPQVGYTGGALNFLPTPIRLLDTRFGSPNGNLRTNAPVAYHGTINVPAAGVTYAGQHIPTGASAVFGLLTAALAPGVNPGDGSSAICWATGTSLPNVVNVVFNPQDLHGAYTASFTMVQCGSGGDISIYNQPINAGVAVDYMFDCFGFVM